MNGYSTVGNPWGLQFGGTLWANESNDEQWYDQAIAALLGQMAAQSTTPNPNCVQTAISDAASATGLNLSGLSDPQVQIAGANDPSGEPYGETELNFSGSAAVIQDVINQMCALGWANNNQCPGGAGNSVLVGVPHSTFTGNFRSPGLTNSVQVNTSSTGIQIDVDPYNPSAYPILGALLHGVLQVLPNMVTGGDSTYGCPAN